MTRKPNAVAMERWCVVTSISPPRRGCRGGPRQPPMAVQQQQRVQALQQQIDELKSQQDSLIEQLQVIHASAVKEKATETAGKVEKLIASQQETFRTRLAQLQQQQQRMTQGMRQRADRPQRTGRRGRSAPDVELKSFDGRTYKLSDLEGRIVVLEWFNMECPFSLYHYNTKPTMVELANKYKDKEVVWLAVNSTNHTKAELRRVCERAQLPYRSSTIGRARSDGLWGENHTPHIRHRQGWRGRLPGSHRQRADGQGGGKRRERQLRGPGHLSVVGRPAGNHADHAPLRLLGQVSESIGQT